MITTHADISRIIAESHDALPHPAIEAGAAPARVAGNEGKLKEGLKPTTLTLNP